MSQEELVYLTALKASESTEAPGISSTQHVLIQPQGRVLIPTGIALNIPFGLYGRIAPRSGLAFQYGIHVGAGVIDPDYCGEIKVLLFNLDLECYAVQPGHRIAQIIFERVSLPRMNGQQRRYRKIWRF